MASSTSQENNNNNNNNDNDAYHHQFENAKGLCLGKRDKSFAGRIDVKAVEICALLNARTEYYTTSSCAGRCFIYRGHGVKSSTYIPLKAVASDGDANGRASLDEETGPDNQQLQQQQQQHFHRIRISHDLIRDPKRYFDMATTETDLTGGGDPIRDIGQFEHAEQVRARQQANEDKSDAENRIDSKAVSSPTRKDQESNEENLVHIGIDIKTTSRNNDVWWLRFEPFILHVCARSLEAASFLMKVARPSFKNVGLTTWSQHKAFYLVAVWGDEGLDMPLTKDGVCFFQGQEAWMQQLVNERHERNWSKIQRFVEAVRAMPVHAVDISASLLQEQPSGRAVVPRSYDVIGDVAVLYSAPSDEEARLSVAHTVLQRNKAIKVVALRTSTLSGSECAPQEGGMEIVAGTHRQPLMTTHSEYGIKCVVDLNHCFFSPRMSYERLRICQQVARGEKVLVLFAGVGMEAFQLVGRTEATVLALELNPVAVQCFRLGHRLLERNSKAVKCMGAAQRLKLKEGDVLQVLPTLPRNHFDRILAPRPKEGGKKDGDSGTGDFGAPFLDALLPVMKQDGSECHWYDFVADHEFPEVERTRRTLQEACNRHQLDMEIVHVANAGSVAMRQYRVCVDFRLRKREAK